MEKKELEFGIDCHPFCRHQQEFADEVSEKIGKEVICTSKMFGAWEFIVESATKEERDQIWALLNSYYNSGKCRGAYCNDPWKKKEG